MTAGGPALKGRLATSHYFALGFGGIVGSGWLVITGSWLAAAGPGGAMAGFLLGGALIALIALCYGELTRRFPEAGAEFIYIRRVFGRFPAFMAGWCLFVYYVAVAVFEAVAFGAALRLLVPGLMMGRLYAVRGVVVSPGELGFGLLGAGLILGLNASGIGVSGGFQRLATYGFLVVAAAILTLMAAFGSASNLEPLFQAGAGRPVWAGVITVFVVSIFMLDGFQAVPQAIEERSPDRSASAVAPVVVASVAGSTLFYVAVIAATSAPTPWTRLAGQPLATVRAAALLPHGALLAKVLLAAGAVSLIKTWNVMIIMAARLLVAMARDGLAPPGLMRLSARRGAPTAALSLATGLSLAGLLVGRAAIDPIIEVSSMILSLLYGASCLALWIVQRREGARALACLTPPLGVAAAVVIGGIAFAEPAQQGPSGMLDYGLVVLWLSAGVLAWRFAPPRQPDATPRAARGAPINHDHPGPR